MKKLSVILLASLVMLTACNDENDGEQGSNTPAQTTAEQPTAPSSPQDLPDFPVNAAADFEYEFDSELNGIAITEYTGTSVKVRIPEEIEGEPVVSIGGFSGTGIIEVYIPDTVQVIRELAFYGCEKLKSVRMGSGVSQIEWAAFAWCVSLESIVIPEGVTELREAFLHCESLKSVTLPESLLTIGNAAFNGCASLESVNLPAGLTTIGAYSFFDCTSLTELTLPDKLTQIGKRAFMGCTALENVSFKGEAFANVRTRYFDNEWVDLPPGLYASINDGTPPASMTDRVTLNLTRVEHDDKQLINLYHEPMGEMYSAYRMEDESITDKTHIEYSLTADTDGEYFAFFPSTYPRSVLLWVERDNNENERDFITHLLNADSFAIYYSLGHFKAGEQFKVLLALQYKEDNYAMFISGEHFMRYR
jgi:hypothetical protein